MSFQWIEKNGLLFLVFSPWWEEGFVHGFTGIKHDFSKNNTQNFLLPKQTHGDNLARVKDFSDGNVPEADGIIIEKEEPAAVGVRTADCLPLIIRGKDKVVLVHAGWRGLANGIIPKALLNFTNNEKLEVVIGPAASVNQYQVGYEVIEAIGESAKYREEPGKYFLALSETAEAQILKIKTDAKIHKSGICTIASSDFHSFRRQKEDRGSNLAFIVF
jgi:YfiH family protein